LKFLVAGEDDGEEQNLKTLTNNLGISKNVSFLGGVEKKTLLGLISQADLVVLSSKIEGNPRVLIETMILQVPIVATNVPGIRDMIKHMKTGYLISNPVPSELAHAIEYVLENPEIACMMTGNAYLFAKQYFSKESVRLKIGREMAELVPKYDMNPGRSNLLQIGEKQET
jgi:glycosyltransferase involved in cell wall biosynthesis